MPRGSDRQALVNSVAAPAKFYTASSIRGAIFNAETLPARIGTRSFSHARRSRAFSRVCSRSAASVSHDAHTPRSRALEHRVWRALLAPRTPKGLHSALAFPRGPTTLEGVRSDACPIGLPRITVCSRTANGVLLASVLLLDTGLLLTGCNRSAGPDDARDRAGVSQPLPPVEVHELRALEAFAALPAGAERARAVFVEASRVLLHPRCVNCHVEGDTPAQGMSLARHDPPVVRGSEDRGVVGMECAGCHQDRNLALSRVPGAPDWRLPPRAMAWVGRTPDMLCEQLKDRERNGQRTLAEVIDHVGHDAFVAWGWAPGADRVPAPGSQPEFAALLGAWADNGGACPPRMAAHD